MALHPDIEAFLELVELGRLTGKHLPMHELSPPAARIQFEQSSAGLDDEPVELPAIEELTLPTRDGAGIPARLYRPSPIEISLPVVLYFHGGGYVVGSLDSHDRLCRDVAARSGCAVMSVGYRLAPEHRFPTAVDDAVDATHWLLDEGQGRGLDTDRVVFAGDSVGGSLATVLAIAAAADPDTVPIRPRLQVLVYPVVDATRSYPSRERHASGLLLETPTLEWFFDHYQRTAGDRGDWRFSPLHAAVPADTAPALLVLAEYDPLVDEGLAYAEHLKASGIAVETALYSGMTHDFLRMASLVEEAGEARGQIGDRIRRSVSD